MAAAYKAIPHRSDAHFVTAAHLIGEHSLASRNGRLVEARVPYTHLGVLVVEEVSHLSYGPATANVLFQVVNVRHLQRRPMGFTTNKAVEEWGLLLHNHDMAEAIPDRVLERGRIPYFKGPLYRTRHLHSEGGPILSRSEGQGFRERPHGYRNPGPYMALLNREGYLGG